MPETEPNTGPDFDTICPSEDAHITIQAAKSGGKVDGFVYHAKGGEFYSESFKIKGTWELRDLEFVKTELKDRGYSPQIKDQKGLSLLDRAIQHIKKYHSVGYVGTVAGYKTGVHEDEYGEFLVPRGPKLIEPKNIPLPESIVKVAVPNVTVPCPPRPAMLWL